MNEPKVSLRADISAEAKIGLKAEAALQGRSLSQLLNEIIINYLKTQKNGV